MHSISMRQDNPQHEILWPVSCKKWGFSRNLTNFLFLLWISFTWNWRKNVYNFLNFLASKVKLADDFMDRNWHKIMKPPYSVGEKMKLTARGCAAARQFHFFPTESGRFHNFSQFHPWNHSQFHFWAKKSEKL